MRNLLQLLRTPPTDWLSEAKWELRHVLDKQCDPLFYVPRRIGQFNVLATPLADDLRGRLNPDFFDNMVGLVEDAFAAESL